MVASCRQFEEPRRPCTHRGSVPQWRRSDRRHGICHGLHITWCVSFDHRCDRCRLPCSSDFVAAHFLTPVAIRRWTRARAAAEGIKSLIFRYRAGALPFRGDDAMTRLQNEVYAIEDKAKDLDAYLAELEDVNASAQGLMTPPASHRGSRC